MIGQIAPYPAVVVTTVAHGQIPGHCMEVPCALRLKRPDFAMLKAARWTAKWSLGATGRIAPLVVALAPVRERALLVENLMLEVFVAPRICKVKPVIPMHAQSIALWLRGMNSASVPRRAVEDHTLALARSPLKVTVA